MRGESRGTAEEADNGMAEMSEKFREKESELYLPAAEKGRSSGSRHAFRPVALALDVIEFV